MWVVMVEVDSAKARGEKIYRRGLWLTFSKLGDYWRIQVMALIFDLIGSCISWYNLSYIIIAAAIVLIERRSMLENEQAKKSNVAKRSCRMLYGTSSTTPQPKVPKNY